VRPLTDVEFETIALGQGFIDPESYGLLMEQFDAANAALLRYEAMHTDLP
jgi:hypothetical protein